MKKSTFLTGLASMLATTMIASAQPGDTYIVKKGDTYSSLAAREIESDENLYFGWVPYTLALKMEEHNKIPAKRLHPGDKIVVPEVKKNKPQTEFTSGDYQLLAKTLYAEAANQSKKSRQSVEEIAKLVNTRIKRPDFPHSLREVIFEEGAFPSIGGEQWLKVENKQLNDYELEVYCDYFAIAKEILSKDKVTESVIYHDKSIQKPSDEFWDQTTLNTILGDFFFYID